jgi:tetratricopeptide (TPR) repeat protein
MIAKALYRVLALVFVVGTLTSCSLIEGALDNYKAWDFYNEKRYAEAEQKFKTSLEEIESFWGKGSVFLFNGNAGLARTYMDQHLLKKAETHFKRSIELAQKGGLKETSLAFVYGEEPISQVYLSFGKLRQKQGRYEEAEALFNRALRIRKETYGADHPQVAYALYYLGELYKTRSQFDEAETLFKRSQAIREKALGPEHPRVATSLNDLAKLYSVHHLMPMDLRMQKTAPLSY